VILLQQNFIRKYQFWGYSSKLDMNASSSTPISLRHVEIFHAVMTSGGVTRAAELLRTSQPTVSRELAAFERLLGFSLFERRSKRLFATEKAIQLHAEVQRSYSGLHQLSLAAQAIRDMAGTRIELACLALFSQTLMPRLCRRLLELEPNSRISYFSLDQPVLLRELLALRYELGLVEAGVAVDGTEVEEIAIGDEVCIVPEGHRLASLDVVRPKDLQGERLISFTSDDIYRRRFHGIFEEVGLAKEIPVETTTAEAVCALVQQGIGVALVNPISARAYRGRGLVARKFSISIPFVVGICRPLGRPTGRLASIVSRIIVDECRMLADDLAARGP
jgi:DNA-binding transcriptional LysR family regulator